MVAPLQSARLSQVDERGVEQVPVVGYPDGKADVMMQRYPAAGGHNPVVRVGIVDSKPDRNDFVRFPVDQERYFGRFAWAPFDGALYLQALSRNEKSNYGA